MKFRPLFLVCLLVSACVSQPSLQNFDKQQAAKARIELALGYLSQNNYQLAKQNLDKALEHAPDYYLVHSALAYFYQQQGNIEQTRQSYLAALKLDNTQGDLHNNYGAFLCAQGEFEAAYQQFDLALSSTNYYRQADSLENKVLCAFSANHKDIYQQSLLALEKIAPERAKKLKQ